MEDFGQKVDLTQRIREVLLNYPEGTTILKEMIQNADDAGASQVCFCVDRRRHAVDSLVSPPLAQWQGPALLAYNNAAFTEEDFQSISRIGDSKKRGQAWKTGRFGIGFNSVYHLSDLPSFVSGSHVVFFDPQCQFLPSVSSLNPGKRIDFVASTALENFPDQFSPYCVFGCDMRRPFGGTLFRFPLRSAEQAATSKLSKQSYTSTDMLELLRDLYHEIVQVMLFLKNVERVEFYEWSAGSSSPTLLYSCAVRLPTSEIRSHRQLFLRLSKGKDAAASEETKDVFRLELVTNAYTGADSGKESLSSFLISQAMGSSASRIGALATNAFKSYGLRLLPWASVAASILPGKEWRSKVARFAFFRFL
ncbi:sacsin-like [Selaginella moellendorffii]|uniref:sacsin-like n=1 Tax=Selaginella moellendorffii TaxID=88036 RepID=UPI000D1CEEB9|nr:sacsin-like [Selaginella moellendorffii]|eukprot:XP_024517929.1 sacsin-like [Selaginella moellendorffii]